MAHLARALGAVGCAALASGAAASELIKGMSYGPTPVVTPAEASQMPEDDYFADEAAPMWSSAGRGDLEVIAALGANFVRLYGNDPRNNHSMFLDEALKLGLSVAPGMSDWPYTQKYPDNCKDTEFNCFTQVKPLYAQNLQQGFLAADGAYHKALRVMNVLNEPDLKMPPSTTTGDSKGPRQMARSLISAFDAMLQAEKEAKVQGPLINFTATFSYAICAACDEFKSSPALGQMAQLDDAMRHPEKYGYTPVNDITEAYRSRWMHSFNTQNPATDLQHQFLDDYNVKFPSTPVYIGEYHRVDADQTDDLQTIFDIVERNELFLGISFFEFTVSYYKTGSETHFGMLGYGDKRVGTMDYFGKQLDIPCLSLEPNRYSGNSMAEAVAQVYGGHVDAARICNRSTTSTVVTSSTTAAATTRSTTFLASSTAAPTTVTTTPPPTSTATTTTTTTRRARDIGATTRSPGNDFLELNGATVGGRPASVALLARACVALSVAAWGAAGLMA